VNVTVHQETVHYNTVHHNTVHHNTVHHNTVHHGTVHHDAGHRGSAAGTADSSVRDDRARARGRVPTDPHLRGASNVPSAVEKVS